MKKIFLLIILCIGLCSISQIVKAQYLYYEPISKPVTIDDGWYKANVKYNNTATYTRATYTLKVKVGYGRITAIDFGNGGSVHSGYNNEGYLYSGGTLTYIYDSDGNPIAVSTRVAVSDNNGMRYFDVVIS